MDDPRSTTPPLSFDRASFSEGGGEDLRCDFCQRSIASSYYEVNGQTACGTCRHRVERMRSEGSSGGRFFKALMGGGVGALTGAGLYYAVVALTGYEFALVAIVVGLLVGFGVRWGSGGAGGRPYQVLAVALTYMAIVSTYIPFIVEEIMKAGDEVEVSDGEVAGGARVSAATEEPAMDEEMPQGGAAVALLFVGVALIFLLAMAAPFLAGLENVIGLLIIGFALYEAWRVNAYQPLVVEGPFELGGESQTAP